MPYLFAALCICDGHTLHSPGRSQEVAVVQIAALHPPAAFGSPCWVNSHQDTACLHMPSQMLDLEYAQWLHHIPESAS